MAAAVVLSLLLSACGFQLRGYHNQKALAEPVNIIIQAPSNSDKQIDYQQFNQQLQRQLTAANIELNPADSRQVAAIVEIESLTFSSQGISRDNLGRATEFNLYCRISYRLVWLDATRVDAKASADSSEAIDSAVDRLEDDNKLVTVSANYFYDPERPTAGELQKRRTEKALLKQAAQLLSQNLITQLQQFKK